MSKHNKEHGTKKANEKQCENASNQCEEAEVEVNEAVSEENTEETAEDEEACVQAEAELMPEEDAEKKIQELTKELASMKEKYFRALADYQNLNKRSSKSILESHSNGVVYIVGKLLPVLDTLDKAMEYLGKAEVDKKVADGLEMFSIQLSDVLHKEGLREMDALGKKFDPHFHEAMMKQSIPDKADEEVVTVFEKGYTFKDRVLRTAKVVVNQL